MNEEKIIEREHENMKDRILTEGAVRQLGQIPETAEYIREFSEDRAFKYDDSGNIDSGNIPEAQKRKHWGTNNPNFVFSNFNSDIEAKRIELMQLDVDLATNQYQVNYPLFNRMRGDAHREIKDPNILKLTLDQIDRLEEYAETKVEEVQDKLNQRVHGYGKVKRAYNRGERMALISKAIITDRPGKNDKDDRPGLSAVLLGRRQE